MSPARRLPLPAAMALDEDHPLRRGRCGDALLLRHWRDRSHQPGAAATARLLAGWLSLKPNASVEVHL